MMRWLAIKENKRLFSPSTGSTASVVKRSLLFMLSLLGLFFLIAILALLRIACDINNRADEQSKTLLQKALQNQQTTLKGHARDYAAWGESYTHLHKTLDTDWAWQKQNLGASLFDDFNYEGIFVIGPQGDTRYSVIEGKRANLTLAQWSGNQPLAALNAALAKNPQEPVSLALSINGQPALLAAAWITTGDDEDVQPVPGPPSMLMFIDQLGLQELRELGEEYGIRDLHVQTAASRQADYRQVALPLALHNASVVLEWRSENPGRSLLLVMLPLMVFISLLTALLAAWLMRSALNKARLNDENHFLLEQSRQALAASERRFRDVVEATTDWIWETDDQLRFTWLSERFPVITGHRIDAWLGRPITQFIECEQIALGDWLLQPGQTAHRGLTHCRYFSAQGHQRYCNLVAKPTTTPEGALSYRGTATDVTLEVEAQERVQYLSHHDELTGLPNRVRMKEFLEGKLRSMPTREHPLAMISLDLDKFKPVNDLFGHGAGDEVLHQISERLRACLRDVDLVARQGGDEFILIIPDIEQKQDIVHLCERIVREIRRPLYIQDHEIFIGASMGIALAPQDAVNATDLLRYSDIALYKAKSAGRNGWVFYSADMEEQIVQRREMEKSLREALKEEQFRLVYQPRYDMKAGRVVAVEALLRWHHPAHGLLMPDQFIPLAEETGLIIPLSDWVLNTACHDAQNELPGMAVSVNISAVEFQTSGLVARVREALHTSKLDPARLALEVTENATLWNPQSSLEIMNGLKALGVRLLIDDFGTGYSSLSYLRNFPFDGIKLDKSFVAGMPHSENANNIVENIIGLGKAFSLSITAEGVETPEQLEQLKMFQCDESQGYLISRPMPLADLKGQIEKMGE